MTSVTLLATPTVSNLAPQDYVRFSGSRKHDCSLTHSLLFCDFFLHNVLLMNFTDVAFIVLLNYEFWVTLCTFVLFRENKITNVVIMFVLPCEFFTLYTHLLFLFLNFFDVAIRFLLT